MRYSVKIAAGAAREIRRLPGDAARQVLDAIGDLAQDPRPSGVKRLEGTPDAYRVRLGVYRMVYTIKDDILHICVVTVGHRKDVYRSLRGKVKRRTR